MPLLAVVLDTTPLGLVTQKAGKAPDADACRAWMETLLLNGVRAYVPEVADYEVRRELLRSGQTAGITRLNNIKTLADYLPITTSVMLTAADLWAQVRNAGIATADIHALDGDVIVAAQVTTPRFSPMGNAICMFDREHFRALALNGCFVEKRAQCQVEKSAEVYTEYSYFF